MDKIKEKIDEVVVIKINRLKLVNSILATFAIFGLLLPTFKLTTRIDVGGYVRSITAIYGYPFLAFIMLVWLIALIGLSLYGEREKQYTKTERLGILIGGLVVILINIYIAFLRRFFDGFTYYDTVSEIYFKYKIGHGVLITILSTAAIVVLTSFIKGSIDELKEFGEKSLNVAKAVSKVAVEKGKEIAKEVKSEMDKETEKEKVKEEVKSEEKIGVKEEKEIKSEEEKTNIEKKAKSKPKKKKVTNLVKNKTKKDTTKNTNNNEKKTKELKEKANK